MDPEEEVYAGALRNLLLIAIVVLFGNVSHQPAHGVLGRGAGMRCKKGFGGWLQPKHSSDTI